ncbi:tripartite tricarboxylate transporter permease [Rhodococcus sp. IEGM 1401]|jgi:putative tricarboxylic transport membrane protein|uniref:Tripartite tricarboxylate transporter permease n=2 Tax=Rhodococcus TaxID=1827 RepID=A0ABU4AWY7_9NOCA|nr:MULTISPECIES: tripartite tricarboxylate transporter permease [Rhodococcus]KZE98143.1 tripartite tricarboxylate transporter TctA [Rhodococcus sp. EPR-147]KZF05037.1 tripartite tricarboxylate transporter TctA [Rhodococcus sp. EPR-279]MCZ4562523.1 tripartite tricarboxylate transporter permease [Rhodococcus sp. IEGM 1401]MDI6629702.1 tripartite tricarboxylate transporter permease [Rhodococcus sp. (in: high G+C Gram-positive bacteria)]MDI9922562.1 tripartite tricarboxylate transporter permease [
MDSLSNLIDGFGTALTPMNLVWVFVGALLGTAVGVLPGLGSAMAVALLLPVTFTLDPTAALIMFAGVYFGGLFGDSISGILMNTPGNSTAIAGTFEGHRMAKNGRAPQALATSAIGAFIGGIVATTLVVFFAPTLAALATNFGPAEYLALAVFAFIATSAVVSDSALKGLTALLIGLTLAVIGIDGPSGASRFTFEVPALFDGIHIVVITVAMLALGEVIHIASKIGRPEDRSLIKSQGRPWLSKAEFRDALPAWMRGTAFGVPFGVIPAGGAEVPSFLAYGTERRLDRKREKPMFGKGAIRGVAGPEAAGNSTAGTAMGALLALGLPTSATAAIMLAAFQQYGMQPGPLLFERSGDIVWALLASLFVAMIVLLILNLPFAPLWAQLLKIPKNYLYAGISVFAALGVYASSASIVDLIFMLGLGIVGFMMRRYEIPLAPVLIAVILGPLAEESLRRALAVSEGDPSILISSGITIVLYALMVIAVVFSIVSKIRARKTADF